MHTRTLSTVIAAVLVLSVPLHAISSPRYSDWSEPVNLGCEVNSSANDTGPALSNNGLSLYFGSTRTAGGFGASDLWVAQRASRDDPWGPPVNLGAVVNTSAGEASPVLSRDGHYLFFQSNRLTGFGLNDIWVSYREDVHDDFAWQAPVNLGPGVNSTMFEGGPAYFENRKGGVPRLFFQRGPSGAVGTDIYVSELQPDGTFGPAVLVPELSSPGLDNRPSVRSDGLELFLFSDRPGSLGQADLWVSTRQSVLDPWGIPTNVGSPVNTTEFSEVDPHISADRLTLLFTSSGRPDGCGGIDMYLTTRTKLKGHDDHDHDDDEGDDGERHDHGRRPGH
jgi:hypothetical protein